MPGQHALLSPSAAHRWMNCTAAPHLEEKIEDKESCYAQEGTLAHAYCAMKLKHFLGLPVDKEKAEIKELNAQYFSGEMEEYTDTYMTIVLEKFTAARAKTKDAKLLVETRLDFSKYVPEAFGTADAIIIADGRMEVIDFKYGKGIRVSAHKNPQMQIYALGAYEAYSFEYNINSVKMTIVQPRIDNISEAALDVAVLKLWAKVKLMPAAKEAFETKGHQLPGDWCVFCKVKSSCKALAKQCINTVQEFEDPLKVSAKDMSKFVLPRLGMIKTWLSGIEEYALNQALQGVNFEGYKVVEGRSNRKITDPEAVQGLLSKNGYDESDYLKPAELRTITDLEKLCGKKKFSSICEDYIEKPQGRPTLVPESDKRPAFNAAADDFKSIEF